MYEPKNELIDHINIYTKSNNILGKMLSNLYFLKNKVNIENMYFSTIEGYWYFLKIKKLLEIQKDKLLNEDKLLQEIQILPSLEGHEAKKISKDLITKYKLYDNTTTSFNVCDTIDFQEKILKAIELKIEQNSDIRNELIKSNLPFGHYYYYGKVENPKIYYLDEYLWLVNGIELLRDKFKKNNVFMKEVKEIIVDKNLFF